LRCQRGDVRIREGKSLRALDAGHPHVRFEQGRADALRHAVVLAHNLRFRSPASLEVVSLLVYTQTVVGGFRHKGLEELYLTGRTRRIGTEYLRKCVRILQSLEVAAQPQDMNVAGYRFHGLQDRPQRWSVRVSGNYWMTFGWSGEYAQDVDFEDYH